MIFVTGDVHDMAMGGKDQEWLKENSELTEMGCAVKYADIAAEYEVPVTLFLTGKVAREEEGKLASLGENEFVEIGGHTWNALRPSWRHHLSQQFLGTYYGPKWVQRRDIEKTLRTIEDMTGGDLVSWRTHGYRGDEVTDELLAEAGLKVVSDEIGPDKNMERLGNDLLSIPINLPPDHEHLYHGKYDVSGEEENRGIKSLARKVLGIEKRKKAFDDFRKKKVDWWSWVQESLDSRLEEQGFATFLLHPACMEILDEMELLGEVFAYLSSKDTAFMSEANIMDG